MVIRLYEEHTVSTMYREANHDFVSNLILYTKKYFFFYMHKNITFSVGGWPYIGNTQQQCVFYQQTVECVFQAILMYSNFYAVNLIVRTVNFISTRRKRLFQGEYHAYWEYTNIESSFPFIMPAHTQNFYSGGERGGGNIGLPKEPPSQKKNCH